MQERPLTALDIPDLLLLVKEMHRESKLFAKYPLDLVGTEKLLTFFVCEATLTFTMGCFNNDKLTGAFIGTIVKDPFCDVLVAEEVGFYILPANRGGLAIARMLRAFKRWAAANEAKLVKLGVSAGIDNEHVAKLLDRVGFKATGTQHWLEV